MRFLFVLLFTLHAKLALANESKTPGIHLSRQAAVKIRTYPGGPYGTGFFIGKQHIATCLHVVSTGNTTTLRTSQRELIPNVKIELPSGDTVEATVVSPLNPDDKLPIEYDFAILRVKHYQFDIVPLKFSTKKDYSIGDAVIFSGFPLTVPTVVTHKGTISGYDAKFKMICIQGSINNGNSGGAICDESGSVVGIITHREGEISDKLRRFLHPNISFNGNIKNEPSSDDIVREVSKIVAPR
jgi:S1-C subfamily serine protease